MHSFPERFFNFFFTNTRFTFLIIFLFRAAIMVAKEISDYTHDLYSMSKECQFQSGLCVRTIMLLSLVIADPHHNLLNVLYHPFR